MASLSNSSLHYTLIRHIIDHGFAPDNNYLSDHFATSEEEIEQALLRLQDYHGVVLHPHRPQVWAIHPFSLAPTNFYIRSAKGEWWGNCAWCSLGVAALLGTDLTIATSQGAEGLPLTINIRNGEVLEKELLIHFPIPMKQAWDNVIYTCSNMLLFESEGQIDNWCGRHNIVKGDIQPVNKIWEFSKVWYGRHLEPNWTKWSVDEAKELFARFGLDHQIWQLDNSQGRF